MTERRVLVGHRALRFTADANGFKRADPTSDFYNDAVPFAVPDAAWPTIEGAAGLPPLNLEQRAAASVICHAYMEEMEDHRLGLSKARFERLTDREFQGLGFLSRDLDEVAMSRTPQGCFALLVNGLGDVYEQVAQSPRTARNDHTDEAKFAPFVRFVLALWLQLPLGNERSRSETAMSSAINAAFSRWSRQPTFANEKYPGKSPAD